MFDTSRCLHCQTFGWARAMGDVCTRCDRPFARVAGEDKDAARFTTYWTGPVAPPPRKPPAAPETPDPDHETSIAELRRIARGE
jgi:hypothetical protein